MLPVTTTSEEARGHFLAGREHAFHYQARQATGHLDAAIAADPHFVLAYLHRAGMSSPAERAPYFAQARAHRGGVSEDEGRMVDAFHAFLGGGRVEDAVEILADLADRYPDDPYLPTYLGLRRLRNLGDLEAAQHEFERARDRDPAFAQAAFWLGEVAVAKGEHGRAAEEFATYRELAPDQPRPYDCLGRLQLRQGHLDEAEHWFGAALERDPDFVDSRQSLARTQVERVSRHLQDALARRDLDAVARLHTAGATVTTPWEGLRSGPAEVAASWVRTLDRSVTVEVSTLDLHLSVEDDIATQVAGYRIGAEDDTEDAGTVITIWLRTADGWRIDRAVWASETTPSSTSAPAARP
jgi:tetratricopeptide (TPR) repeat protein